MNNEELILETIISTPDGSGLATKGKELEQKWNVNSERIANNINAIWDLLATCIVSDDIVSIRINGATHKAEYTTDPLDGTEEWHLLANVEWSDINGDPMASTALAAIVNSMASAEDLANLQTDVVTLANTVETNTADILIHDGELENHEIRISQNEASIDQIQNTLVNKVDVVPGQYLMLRHNADTGVEYSIDGGTTWNMVTSSLQWNRLVGSPTTNDEFMNFIRGLVGYMFDEQDFESISVTVEDWIQQLEQRLGQLIATKVGLDEFANHTNDISNPHNVTKEQIGLSQVQNLSPAEMPVSDATQALFESIEARNIKFRGLDGFNVMSRSKYNSQLAAGDLDMETIYFVSRHNTDTIGDTIYVNDTVDISQVGTGYSDGDVLFLSLESQDLNVQLSYDSVEDEWSLSIIQQGRSHSDFAGLDIPLEGGSGTGLTVDITTLEVEED